MKFIPIICKAYLGFSLASILSVSINGLLDPQGVMDLVQVTLPNTDAISSIRGVYGGVGFTVCMCILYLFLHNLEKGVVLLTVFWGSYAISRLITLLSDGPLGTFGQQWLMIESILCLLGLGIWFASRLRKEKQSFILKAEI